MKAQTPPLFSLLKMPALETACALLICLGACSTALAAKLLTAPQSPVSSLRINVNSATLEELMTLPGMHRRRANSILKAREKSGRFSSVQALSTIKGVTPAYLKRVEDLIEVQ